ncbi:MAG: putative oxidoreductase [Acidimicrobiaceae bacterium]|nr:MAG: putative oxidoreductase [Acidimicrobiaceae bacterium]
MQYTRFGRTGLQVSRLCLGTMTFGAQCDRDQSFAIMDAALESGITFFDTADMYPAGNYPDGAGDTERIIGAWMRDRRADVLVATKCFFPTGRRRWEQGNSRHNIIRSLDSSLARLGTDHVDLFQVHSWDARTPIDETLRALDDVVRAGKVRYVGCSNVLAYQLARSVGRAEVLRTVRFESVQPRYNLLFREFERELFPFCTEEQIAVIPYNPLAGGFLSGKHRPADEAGGTRFAAGDQGARYRERYWHEQMFATADAVRDLAADAGVSMATLALQWVLANPVVTSPIVGASQPAQLADAVAAAATPLDPVLKARLDELTHQYRSGDSQR